MAIATQTNCNGILLDQFKCIFDPSGPENGQILAKIVRNLAKISKNHIYGTSGYRYTSPIDINGYQ